MPSGPQAVYSQYSGGNATKLNQGATPGLNVVKSAPGVLKKIIILAVGTGATIAANDAATGAAVASSNLIFSLATAQLTPGQVINVDWPCLAGIALTTTGTGLLYSVAYF